MEGDGGFRGLNSGSWDCEKVDSRGEGAMFAITNGFPSFPVAPMETGPGIAGADLSDAFPLATFVSMTKGIGGSFSFSFSLSFLPLPIALAIVAPNERDLPFFILG
jgi:hypothetical protein